jgi:sirohydrochlorin ferrochelatase
MSTKATELRTPGNKASKGAGVSLADDIAIKPGAAPQAREAGWRACVAQADARAAALAQVIAEIRAAGTPHAIAAALTARRHTGG